VIAWLLILATAMIVGSLVACVLWLRWQLADMRHQFEEESMWAAEYMRQAATAREELAEMRIEYTKILWLHDGAMWPIMALAWRAGIKVGKGK